MPIENRQSQINRKYLIVSLHDFHPGSRELIDRQVAFLKERGVKQFSILAIPHYHHQQKLSGDPASLEWLDKQAGQGNDVVLHGFYHDRLDRHGGSIFFTKFYTANEAEFLDLPDEEVKQRVSKGSQLWNERGWPLNGFIAPAWLMPERQDALLKEMGFSYTTRLRAIHHLKRNQVTQTQSLCWSTRAGWRRVVSKMWNEHLFQRLRKKEVMRLSLHPCDLTFPAIRSQIAEILQIALADGFQPVSYSQYVAM